MKCNAATKTVILLTTALGVLAACRHEKAVTTSSRPAETYTPVTTTLTMPLLKPAQKAVLLVPAKAVRHWSTYEYYQQALAELEQLLNQPQPDFKRAVFITENAYYKQELDYKAFQMQVDALTALCKSWMQANTANNYHAADSMNMLKNQAICMLISDTLFLFEDVALHYPYRYNFTNLQSPDQTSQFVTRLLASGTGNCHAMPYLYKILADELGAKAWLSLAPNHIYLKQYSQKLGWYNTELTSSTFPTDAWVKASGYITLDAIRSGMYMDTLSHSQSIAMCAFDLAKGYLAQTADDTSSLVLRCCNLVLQYQPLHTGALVLKAETLRKRYAIQANPAVKQEMQTCYRKALKGGYRQMPTALYQSWLSTPAATSVYQPANPFASIGKKGKVVTLSRGRYPEVQANDSLQPIGPVIVSMSSGEVKQLLAQEEESLPDATLINRWYSVDPLVKDYVPFSPYNYTLNNPISLMDKDGRVVVDRNGNEVKISIAMAEDGTATAQFTFADDTPQEVIDDFMQNGGRIINAMIQVPTGREQLIKAIFSKDRLEYKIDESVMKEETETGIKYKLGSTVKVPNIDPSSGDEIPAKEEESLKMNITVYTGSISEFMRKGGAEWINKNGLTEEQVVGTTGSHESEHATNPVDRKALFEGIGVTSEQHKTSINKGIKAADEMGNINKKNKAFTYLPPVK